jgi:hypothetical protein
LWQQRKVELLGGPEVSRKAELLSDALRTNYTELSDSHTITNTSSVRLQLLNAMQQELDLLDETSPATPPKAQTA